jgi:hypothetical protein
VADITPSASDIERFLRDEAALSDLIRPMGFQAAYIHSRRARIAGRSVTLAQLATRMRCSQCGKKVSEVVAVARPRPRGVPMNPQ